MAGDLYPVSGPLSKVSPLPVVKMKIEGVTGNSGPVSLTLPSGEFCKGRWSVTAPRMGGVVSTSASARVSSGLETAFVEMNGTSYVSVAKPGVNKGQAVLVGEKGAIIECAFLVGSGTASGYGTAVDNRGNVYKVLF